jgi:hypothetical protein
MVGGSHEPLCLYFLDGSSSSSVFPTDALPLNKLNRPVAATISLTKLNGDVSVELKDRRGVAAISTFRATAAASVSDATILEDPFVSIVTVLLFDVGVLAGVSLFALVVTDGGDISDDDGFVLVAVVDVLVVAGILVLVVAAAVAVVI